MRQEYRGAVPGGITARFRPAARCAVSLPEQMCQRRTRCADGCGIHLLISQNIFRLLTPDDDRRNTSERDANVLQVLGVTNPLGLGFDSMAMVGVKTAGPPERVADQISGWDEADYVVVTAGQYDLVVEVVAADRRGLLDVTNRMRELDGVVSTETFLYLDLVKQLYDWGTQP